ncbi:MAG: hypothetical protein HZC37_08585 [Burkholderiales bacterium]|nr:hypothetical protein [Burkholderiales bacterium]
MIVEERERFEREYGCTEAEWRGWMPAATGGHECVEDGPQALRVLIGAAGCIGAGDPPGHLRLQWRVLPPRVIALVRVPRLAVSFAFEGVPLAERREFLRRLDLHLQRGGG